MLAQWRDAIGRRQRSVETLELESLRRYALAIGGNGDVEQRQPALPHWAFFLPRPTDGDLGADGHARRGGFLPPVSLPRRMFAGSSITFVAPLLLAAEAEMTATIVDVAHKSGRSGDLVFVDLENELVQQGSIRVTERKRFVYRAEEANAAPPVLPQPCPEAPSGELWEPTTTHLFRFSAATFNAHRIHYDAPYAAQVENYPSLVVHGPFTAAKLAALAERAGALTKFEFRAQAPLFQGQPIRLQADRNEVRAVRCDGVTAMVATVGYA